MATNKKARTFAELKQRRTEFKKQIVHVEEWDTDVWVAQLSGRQQQTIADLTRERKDDEDWGIEDMAKILAMALQDDQGEHPETDWLMEQPFPVLQTLTQKTLEINGLSTADQEEMRKNSSKTSAGEDSSKSLTA